MNFEGLAQLFRLDGRTAVVTGIGPGIGEQVARAMSAAGANVVVVARTAAKVERLASFLRDEGGNAVAIAADVGVKADIARVVRGAHDAFGPVSILFNNAASAAGQAAGRDPLTNTDDEWQECFAVNLLASYRFAQALVPEMVELGEGTIINMLSGSTFRPDAGIAAWPYATTKAGLAMLTRFIAKEYGPEVRANCIAVGATMPERDSALVPIETVLAREDSILKRADAALGMDAVGGAMKRVGYAREVVPAALFLASRASSYTTGQTIYVDGGRVETAT